MKNRDQVKCALREANIPQWRLADYLGIREDSLSRMFRYELQPDKAGELLLAIKRLKKEMKISV